MHNIHVSQICLILYIVLCVFCLQTMEGWCATLGWTWVSFFVQMSCGFGPADGIVWWWRCDVSDGDGDVTEVELEFLPFHVAHDSLVVETMVFDRFWWPAATYWFMCSSNFPSVVNLIIEDLVLIHHFMVDCWLPIADNCWLLNDVFGM